MKAETVLGKSAARIQKNMRLTKRKMSYRKVLKAFQQLHLHTAAVRRRKSVRRVEEPMGLKCYCWGCLFVFFLNLVLTCEEYGDEEGSYC